METSVEAAELLAPSPLETGSLDGDSASSATFDPMEEFSRRLQDILRTHGSAEPVATDNETEKTPEEVKGHMETDVSLIRQRLSNLPSAEDRLEELVQQFAELAALWRGEQQKKSALHQKLCHLLEERRCSMAARGQLEALCRDLQAHYGALREETLRRSREDEEKRSDITNHFQETLTEIQAQIELHSGRNDKLRQENANLTDKLEGLMSQYERREESLEKINKHHDLQHKLTEAKLQQANALLAEAEDKHKREKEYLLREAIDKTKKCFAMKEQELAMKKKLALYAQKFDEFQATLAKSNEIYVRFKQEMDNMTEKMKKVEKEANLWKTRFENCNKTLIDMIEERTEKGREYNLFVLKIQKLEKLCRALQEERKGLYDKIREVRQSSAGLPSKLANFTENAGVPEDAGMPDLEGLQELQQDDPVLTENIVRLRQEQAKLQEFAAALLAAPGDNEEQEEKKELGDEDDIIVSAIAQFQTRTNIKEGLASAPGQAEGREEKAEDPPVVLLKGQEPQGTRSEPTDSVAPPEVEQSPTQVREDVQQSATSEPGKEDPEPGRADTEPARADPEPAKGDPEPARADPEPGRADPEPGRADPEPGIADPEPGIADPEPGRADPEPGRADPEPAKGDPEPGRADPEPGRMDPEPGRGDPEPGRVDPEPARADPEPARGHPEPARADPEPGRVDPEPEALETERLKETRFLKPVLPVEEILVQQLPSGPEPGESSKPSDGSTKAAGGKQIPKKKKKRNSKSTS
ncbi:beta-taxilin isoform X4 [Xiphophorus couchianus]|uniref:beta-taxilin isoform X4 n=1 Tax=Xiphophorus couchianus TaxID=32473 RepID=UPI0010170F0D|nr:beta-taxilin isoform X4 [Xiphophorus couchianus]